MFEMLLISGVTDGGRGRVRKAPWQATCKHRALT